MSKWTVETMGHDTTMEAQCHFLTAGVDTPDEWQPIMVSDEDGPCEVVALAHPSTAARIVRAVNAHDELVAALEEAADYMGEMDHPADTLAKARAALRKARGEGRET